MKKEEVLLRPLFQYLTQQFLCLLSAFLMMVHRVYICLNCSFSLQNVSALDLASLSDNAPVATYLARLLESLGFDPNEPNKQGHTVLHLLARKGDDCSDTLERLLKMKKTSNPKERLFRIDVINKGRKTPLDVAATCSHMFSTGKDRAVYTQTINHFQDVIIDEAEGLMNLWCVKTSPLFWIWIF